MAELEHRGLRSLEELVVASFGLDRDRCRRVVTAVDDGLAEAIERLGVACPRVPRIVHCY